jgi:hypothetical protein
MNQDRLLNLGISSIESEDSRKFDFQSVLEEFTEQKFKNM